MSITRRPPPPVRDGDFLTTDEFVAEFRDRAAREDQLAVVLELRAEDQATCPECGMGWKHHDYTTAERTCP